MKQKSWILSLLALVLIACAMVQPALAYFTANTQADGKIPLHFGRKTEIEEKVDGLHKAVTIKNTGGDHPEYADPVWVRAKAYVGQEYLQYLEVSGTGWTSVSDPDDPDNPWWVFGTPVPVGGTAEVLNVSLVNMPADHGEEHQFKDVNVAVVYESVTAYYNFDADGQPAGFKPADWTAKILDSATSSPTPETP